MKSEDWKKEEIQEAIKIYLEDLPNRD